MAAIVHRVDMTPEERYMLPAREFVNLPTFYQYPAQWINCDVRTFDYSILGKFGVVMADPPWAIHMDVCLAGPHAWPWPCRLNRRPCMPCMPCHAPVEWRGGEERGGLTRPIPRHSPQLPYGTMEDDEMKRMSIPVLQVHVVSTSSEGPWRDIRVWWCNRGMAHA
jgi:hypothetical protein